MPKIKAIFYLPIQDNDGRRLLEEIMEVENLCFKFFRGFTFTGYVEGAWRMETGEKVIDTSKAYHVVLDTKELGKLREILLEFKLKTTQEAIYLEIVKELDVEFL